MYSIPLNSYNSYFSGYSGYPYIPGFSTPPNGSVVIDKFGNPIANLDVNPLLANYLQNQYNNTNTNNTTNTTNNTNDTKDPFDSLYYQIPLQSYYYQDIGNDNVMRSKMVKFFYDQIKVWYGESFSDLSKYMQGKNENEKYEDFKNKLTKDIIYKILKRFVKKTNIKWYELDKYIYKSKIKSYIHNKLDDYFGKKKTL